MIEHYLEFYVLPAFLWALSHFLMVFAISVIVLVVVVPAWRREPREPHDYFTLACGVGLLVYALLRQ